jgi:hypothetical protein
VNGGSRDKHAGGEKAVSVGANDSHLKLAICDNLRILNELAKKNLAVRAKYEGALTAVRPGTQRKKGCRSLRKFSQGWKQTMRNDLIFFFNAILKVGECVRERVQPNPCIKCVADIVLEEPLTTFYLATFIITVFERQPAKIAH